MRQSDKLVRTNKLISSTTPGQWQLEILLSFIDIKESPESTKLKHAV